MSDKPPRPSGLIPYKPGQSGNPGGKATGTRNRIQSKFLLALADDFDEHGADAIKACREQDPAKYVQIVAALLPKQVEQHKPLDDMEDAELAAGIAILRGQLASRAGEGTGAPSGSTTVN